MKIKKFNESTHVKNPTLLDTIRINIDNDKLSDKDFRQFVKNTLSQKTYTNIPWDPI